MPNKLLILMCLGFYTCNVFAFDLNKQIQKTIDQDRIRYQLPALSVSIKIPEVNNPHNYVSGYYSMSDRKKISPDTLFQIGSITKTVTAVILLKLVEDNKINLNDKITKWLPQYSRWKDITVENLLRHTSGIENYTHGKKFDVMLQNNPHEYFSLFELVNLAYTQADLSRPGEKYNYTNTDYLLLGMILEKIMHKPLQKIFDDFLQQYHLQNTFYTPAEYPGNTINRIAQGYNRDGTFKFNEDVTLVSMSFMQSAGAMISTPHDLMQFLNQLFTGKIVGNKSLAMMMTPISEKNAKPMSIKTIISASKQLKPNNPFIEIGSGIGMGLINFKKNGFVWAHAGGTTGYESFYAYNPCNGVYLVLMYNVKPKQQLIFIKIADDILYKLNQSEIVKNNIKSYQKHEVLPAFCQK